MTPGTGKQLGHYSLLSLLGRGGMGEVYLAEDVRLARRVALKLLPAEFTGDADRVRRFEQEARAASALNHPNILTIYEIGRVEGTYFIATEFIEGRTLRERLTNDRPAMMEALDITIQIAAALSAAHRAGILHRDIKPENVMLRPDGYAKVLDFGLVKLVEQPQASDTAETLAIGAETKTGIIMGTPRYMSPEQARGERADARSDIFSLGVVMYEMVAGRAPFSGPTPSHILVEILEKTPAPLNQFAPDTPHELERIVRKTLEKEREARYQSVKELMDDVTALKQEMEFQARLGRVSGDSLKTAVFDSPHLASTLPQSVATVVDAQPTGRANETARTASSDEYVVSGLRRHKRGVAAALIVLAALLAGGAYFIARFFVANRTQPASPLATMRFARLTASGKATHAVISADGRYVVHVADDGKQQSLWLRQTATASNVQIAPPAAIEYFGLTFSRDGNYLFYVAAEPHTLDGALYQIPVLGGPAKKILSSLSSPVTFSPDGQRLAFVRRNAAEGRDALVIAQADGTNERTIAGHTGFDTFYEPAWSPEGRTIAVAASKHDDAGHLMEVIEVPAAGGRERAITKQRWPQVGQVAWLADGSALLVNAMDEATGGFQIWRVSYPDGAAERITNDLNDYRGLSLAESADAMVTMQVARTSHVWVAPQGDASRARQLTSGPASVDGLYGLAWMPDGRLVYSSNASGAAELWVMAADGSAERQLTNNGRANRFPAVSPDGRYIVFESDRSGAPNIWRMDADGGNLKQLTRGKGETLPHFSPDGKSVVYSLRGGDQINLWRVPVDGGEAVPLGNPATEAALKSPDGRLVACLHRGRQEDSSWAVGVHTTLGGSAPNLLVAPPFSWQLVRTTPDGRAVTYIDHRGGASNLWRQPLGGGPPQQVTNFQTDRIYAFDWSRDAKQLALARGAEASDVVLITNFKRPK